MGTFVFFSNPFSIWGDDVKNLDNGSKIVFLTFDDGPSDSTVEVLGILEEKGVNASFFLIGDNVENYPLSLNNVLYLNHSLGIHTMSHPYLYKNVSEELILSKNLIENILGRSICLFRPPYGFTTPFVYKKTNDLGLKVVLWDVFPRDYKNNCSYIVDYVNENVKDGSIIVLHDAVGNRSQMICALPKIIDNLREKGYEFKKLEDYVC